MRRELIDAAEDFFNAGILLDRLSARVAIQSVSQNPDNREQLILYLETIIIPELVSLGFHTEIVYCLDRPFLMAERHEGDHLPTILMYGHGDVVWGNEGQWHDNLDPWTLTVKDEKWYGRGTADNKGQHTINFAALELILKAKSALDFNCKILFEMGEEISSPGLEAVVLQYQDRLQADIFIASDGPRVSADRPTLFLGSRGGLNIGFEARARNQDYHSGNWGGLLSNPAIQLMHALGCIVDKQGQILLKDLMPPPISPEVRDILQKVPLSFMPGDPEIDEAWGEKGLTASEKLYGWNSFEILSLITGNPENTMNAIPGFAKAVCQLRFVVGTDQENVIPTIRETLKAQGLDSISVTELSCFPATRFDPKDPLVNWTLEIMESATHTPPALLPNLGGSIPNSPFSDVLNLPTLWIPHSYPACCQHGPNEHLLPSIALEGLKIMTHLFDEIGNHGSTILAAHHAYQLSQNK